MISCSNDFKQSNAWQAGCQTKLRHPAPSTSHLIFHARAAKPKSAVSRACFNFSRTGLTLEIFWNHWTSLMECVTLTIFTWKSCPYPAGVTMRHGHRTQEQLCESCEMESWWKCEITQLRPTKVWRKFPHGMLYGMTWLDDPSRKIAMVSICFNHFLFCHFLW